MPQCVAQNPARGKPCSCWHRLLGPGWVERRDHPMRDAGQTAGLSYAKIDQSAASIALGF